jgi:hypothetical protein
MLFGSNCCDPCLRFQLLTTRNISFTAKAGAPIIPQICAAESVLSTFRETKEASVIIVLDIDETHCCYKSSMIPVHITCVRTVSEPLRMKVLEICFERKADSPSCCFFGKAVSKRRAFRPGVCAPKAGVLRSDG